MLLRISEIWLILGLVPITKLLAPKQEAIMQALTIIQEGQNSITLRSEDVEAAKGFISCQLSEATKRAYVSDCKIFAAWCNKFGVSSLPASPEVVTTFLSYEATQGAKYATIGRRAAAINFAHISAELDSPTKSHLVAAALKGIRRNIGVAPTKKAPATSKKIVEMVRLCPPTLQGKRDKALLLLGFAGAFRRSELVGLEVADIAEESSGLRVVIRKSKTDQEGKGQSIAITRGEVFCPVVAVFEYLEAAGIKEGPIFRAVTKSGTVRPEALSTKSVAEIVKAYATRAGFDATEFSGHSLRAGFLTSAAEAGANVFKMVEVSRHKSIETVRGYVRHVELFKNHAGAGLL